MNPTLLVSWWATGFAIVTILVRVTGRFVRTEKLFREDKIMFYSIIPLLIRMGLIHVVLIWGTNNTVTTGLDATDIRHREIGSKLVLAARVFYAAFIWIAKYSLIEFLKRLISRSWHKSYSIAMRAIDVFLLLTFLAVVISTLTECRPFSHYWQVVPDPGPHCREALAQLITMGVCDIVTDLVLIVFPIPLVIMSAMPLKRKINLILLFLMSLILIAITAYRVPSTINRHAAQQYRSLLASLEILAAAGVANAIVIGSFIRDRGVKKAKYRAHSIGNGDVLERTSTRAMSIAQHHWGSDEDLGREFGLALSPGLQRGRNLGERPRLAPVALPNSTAPAANLFEDDEAPSTVGRQWNFATGTRRRRGRRRSDASDSSTASSNSSDMKMQDVEKSRKKMPTPAPDEILSPRKMSFFDVGGLIGGSGGDDNNNHSNHNQQTASSQPQQTSTSPEVQSDYHPLRSSRAFLSDIGGLLSSHRQNDHRSPHRTPSSQPDAEQLPPRPPVPGPVDRLRSSSQQRRQRRSTSSSPGPAAAAGGSSPRPSQPRYDDGGPDSLTFGDAGGLLS